MTTPLPAPTTTPGVASPLISEQSDGRGVAQYGTFKGKSNAARRGSQSKDPASHQSGLLSPESIPEILSILFLVFLWYVLNTLYNLDNKKAVKMLPLPWTVSTIQLFVGYFWFIPLWLLNFRRPPVITNWEAFWWKLAPQGLFHFWVHAGACISMAAGAVSFTQIVKAGEPVMTAIFAAGILGEWLHPLTYLTLLPVVGGVSLAALKELSFTWLSFWAAMISNLGSSLRSIFAKKVMSNKKEIGENLNEGNMYALLTIISSILALGITIYCEGTQIRTEWMKATLIHSPRSIVLMVLRSGVWYYSYNEVAFFTLGRLNAVTHAVANTLKRVVIIIASIIAFRTPVTFLGGLGSATAVAGTLLYSLVKQKFH